MSAADLSARRSKDTEIPDRRYDSIIVGAGVSGLSLAALLSRAGQSVLVLESINYPGGCASSYKAEGAWFDVGATTFCGADPGQPLSLLFSEIGTFPGLLPSDPTLSVIQDGRRLDLTTDRSEWVRRMSERFGGDQRAFWDDMFSVSDAVYRAVRNAAFLPPTTPGELFSTLPAASIDLLSKLPTLFATVHDRLAAHSVGTEAFRRFVDAQLLITNQTRAEDAYVLNGALGLTYANGRVYSVKGGMISFARFLEDRARSFGADVVYLQRVSSITRNGNGWSVGTAKQREVRADRVITQVPVFNLPSITEGDVSDHFARVARAVESSGVRQWGAVTLYALVPDVLPDGFPLNTQIILDSPMPVLGSDTLFCTFSHPDDHERAPSGYRTLSISTHVPAGWLPASIDADEYRRLKDVCGQQIMAAVRRYIPELSGMRPVFQEIGTPKTFRKYTGRFEGLVGGIPLSRKIFPWKYPRSVTPFPGLYAMGDTFFPGQGIPGVVLGALGIYRRMMRKARAA